METPSLIAASDMIATKMNTAISLDDPVGANSLDPSAFNSPASAVSIYLPNSDSSTEPQSLATTASAISTDSLFAGSFRDRSRASRRELDTIAARQYRQRWFDCVSRLEVVLEAVKLERDDLKLRVSKLDGKPNRLKGFLELQNQSGVVVS
ncbi:hypothetical protein N7475_004066 [Penicillium sp. IBT 31633x]|nr:hypothetical protein N7475_004066 [Penicillium sp. IBT 31633x]